MDPRGLEPRSRYTFLAMQLHKGSTLIFTLLLLKLFKFLHSANCLRLMIPDAGKKGPLSIRIYNIIANNLEIKQKYKYAQYTLVQ